MSECKEKDIYRDSPIRLLGYASELGEAFRPLIHVNLVRLTYVVESGYVLADVIHKRQKAYTQTYETEAERRAMVIWSVADTLVWQGLATLIIPALAMNRICALTLYILHRYSKFPDQTQRIITSGICAASIPFIFKPIDKFVTVFMDSTIRHLYGDGDDDDDE